MPYANWEQGYAEVVSGTQVHDTLSQRNRDSKVGLHTRETNGQRRRSLSKAAEGLLNEKEWPNTGRKRTEAATNKKRH